MPPRSVGKWHLGALPIRAAAEWLRSFLRFPGRRRGLLHHVGENRKDDLWDDDVEVPRQAI
jgi:hypothetical protein